MALPRGGKELITTPQPWYPRGSLLLHTGVNREPQKFCRSALSWDCSHGAFLWSEIYRPPFPHALKYESSPEQRRTAKGISQSYDASPVIPLTSGVRDSGLYLQPWRVPAGWEGWDNRLTSQRVGSVSSKENNTIHILKWKPFENYKVLKTHVNMLRNITLFIFEER